jgi:hypothetical protein
VCVLVWLQRTDGVGLGAAVAEDGLPQGRAHTRNVVVREKRCLQPVAWLCSKSENKVQQKETAQKSSKTRDLLLSLSLSQTHAHTLSLSLSQQLTERKHDLRRDARVDHHQPSEHPRQPLPVGVSIVRNMHQQPPYSSGLTRRRKNVTAARALLLSMCFLTDSITRTKMYRFVTITAASGSKNARINFDDTSIQQNC